MKGYPGRTWWMNCLLPVFRFLSNQEAQRVHQRYNELVSAGMNWHLFETIDIVKYASGDTLHLPVYPLKDLPDHPTENLGLEERTSCGITSNCLSRVFLFLILMNLIKNLSTYGIVEGTNIGYIYLLLNLEGIFGFNYNTDEQFYEAVRSLSGTEGLIIDLRLNFGGWSLFNGAFKLLFNTRQYTLDDAIRCSQRFNSLMIFSLCPTGSTLRRPNLLFIRQSHVLV